jgi:CBS domain-containing protein
MTRREDHFDALLRHLGAAYYQTLRGQATPSDVARALDSVAREEKRQHEATRAAEPPRRTRPGRWRVRDVMTTDTVTVDKRATGAVMARLMSEHHINALPVLTGGRRVAGVVSEADLLRTQHAPPGQRRGWLPWRRSRRARPEDYTAAQLMTAPAVTIHPDAPLAAAARRMTGHNLTMLPVVDASGELMGVVSRRDLLRVFLRPDDEIAGEVRHVLTSVLLLDPAAVTVAAHDGLVTLSGQVERPELAALATRLASDVDGVLAVVDNLTVAGQFAGRQQG